MISFNALFEKQKEDLVEPFLKKTTRMVLED